LSRGTQSWSRDCSCVVLGWLWGWSGVVLSRLELVVGLVAILGMSDFSLRGWSCPELSRVGRGTGGVSSCPGLLAGSEPKLSWVAKCCLRSRRPPKVGLPAELSWGTGTFSLSTLCPHSLVVDSLPRLTGCGAFTVNRAISRLPAPWAWSHTRQRTGVVSSHS
jgi:hypothetical protein